MGHLRKRGESWELRVSVAGSGAGRRMVTRTIKGTRKAAVQALAILELEVGRGEHQGSSANVAELIQLYILSAQVSPTTAAEYRRAEAVIAGTTLARLPIWKVRAPDLDITYREMNRGGVNVHTVRRCHEMLSAAFGRAIGWGWLNRNPAEHATPPPRPRSERGAADPVDVAKLIQVCPPKLALWLRLAFVTGSRRGELCAIKWRDINLDTGTLTIRRNVVYSAETGLVVKDTKEETVKVVALDAGTIDGLRAHREVEIEVAGTETIADRWVFTHDTDGCQPWRPDYVTLALNRLKPKAGVIFKIHEARHAMATQLLDAGFAMSVVKERLGHDREETTRNFYSHALRARDRQAADHLGALLDG